MSKMREIGSTAGPELRTPAGSDLQAWEVFVQLERGKPVSYAGSVDAIDAEMALQFGREHYGRDQPCVQVWVTPREAVFKTTHDTDVVWRLSDQSYRQARGYGHVRKMWQRFRSAEDLAAYAREDLKEGF